MTRPIGCLQGTADLPLHFHLSPLWTYGSGVPKYMLNE